MTKPITIMEVCGTHTVTIAKNGLRQLFKGQVNFVSGPGCPVCVSDQSDIDAMLSIAQNKDTIITTFGDMLRVSGSDGQTLQNARINGADIRIIYNPLDALDIAQKNPAKTVVFLAVGFETTAPIIAALAIAAQKKEIKNFAIYCCLKQICPAIEGILKEGNNIDAFILPGNVSVITGIAPYAFIAQNYNKPGIITGFSGQEVINAVQTTLQTKKPQILNQYIWAKPQGNSDAQALLKQVFNTKDAYWRGFGLIPKSAFELNDSYSCYDAKKIFKITIKPYQAATACKCAAVLKGQITPLSCPFFGKACTPQNPLGPCMVSTEGACGAYYDY